MFGSLLRCPQCGAGSLRFARTVDCQNCAASFAAPAGIIDFVAGRSDTALDVAEYDQQKAVTLAASLNLFRHLKTIAGDIIPDHLGTVLEIGAGTGMLTLAMVAESDFDRAVITDISPAMLALCAARLDGVAPQKRERIALATYSGSEPVFAPGQFDLCIANSVLHHVLDDVGLLKTARAALKPSGAAVFIEPGAIFHEALTAAVLDAITSVVASGASTEAFNILAQWTEQTLFRLRSAPTEIAHLEDKHIFRRADLADKARDAGFAGLTILPFTYDPLGLGAMANYLRELHVPDAAAAAFMPIYQRHAAHRFGAVSRDDMSEMYLLAFHAA